MAIGIKKIVWGNVAAVVIAIQVVLLGNYWYFIYNNITNAAINNTIVYQGKLVDTNSVPIPDGSYNMKFSIYNAVSGGTLLWTETWNNTNQGIAASRVTVTKGLFTIDLNSLCGDWTAAGSCDSNGGVDFNTSSLYLQIELDRDLNGAYEEVFAPRKRFSSTAYAMNADKLDGYDTGTTGGVIPLLNTNNTWTGLNTFTPSSAGTKGIVVKGVTSQSANLIEFQSYSGTPITAVNDAGFLETYSLFANSIESDATGIGEIPSTTHPNLIGYWKFDEGTGASSNDEVSTNDATITNATWNGSGRFGYTGDNSITLDGTGDYASPGDLTALNSTSAFTVNLWTQFTDKTALKMLFSKVTTATTNEIDIQTSGSAMYVLVGNSTTSYGSVSIASLSNNTWYNVSMVFDGSQTGNENRLKLYINGVLQTLTFVGTIPASTGNMAGAPVYFGRHTSYSPARDWAGKIDNVTIYNSALTASDIENIYNESDTSRAAVVIDTTSNYSGSQLFSIKNNGTTKAYFDSNGNLTTPSVTSTGQVLISPTTNIVPLKITASSAQTQNLAEWRNNAGTLLASINKNGDLTVSSVSTTELITPRNVSSSATTTAAPSLSQPNIMSYWKMDDNKIPIDVDTSMIGYWKMDSGSGTTAVDATTNGNNGTLTTTTWTTGQFGYSGDFSTDIGVNGYINFTDKNAFTFGNGSVDNPFSIEAWVNPDTLPANSAILSKVNYTTGAREWGLFVKTGAVYLATFDSNGDCIGRGKVAALTTGSWQHVGVSYSGSKAYSGIRVYINGVEVSTYSNFGECGAEALYGGMSNTATAMHAGDYVSDASAIEEFDGKLDGLVLYSQELSGTDFLRSYTKGRADKITDYTNASPGTITSATFAGTPNGAFGYTADNSLDFDGTYGSKFVQVDSTTNLNDITNGTVNFWYRPSYTGSPSNISGFFSKSNASVTKATYGAYHHTDGKIYFDLNLGATPVDCGAWSPSASTWYMMSFTWDGVNAKCYVNGVQLGSVANTDGSGTSTNPFFIGAYVFNTEGTKQTAVGRLDNFMIFNDDMTALQLLTMYNETTGSGVAHILDSQNQFTAGTSKLVSIRNYGTEKLSIGLNAITFTGDADKTFSVDRTTATSTAGYALTIQSGGGTSGGTNLDGGSLIISTGIATGTGSSLIEFKTSGGGSSGTSDVTPTTKLSISGDGSVRIADNSELRMYDTTFYVGFTAPTLAANKIWTLPTGDGTSNQILTTNGSGALSWTNTTDMYRTNVTGASYTVDSGSVKDVYLGVTNTGTVTITLPAASTMSERVIVVKDEDGTANSITIDPNASETIDGATTYTVNSIYGTVKIYCNGTAWFTY